MALLTLFLSCHQGKVSDTAQHGDTVAMKYAENIYIVHYEGYTRVDLANPWKKGEILHTYILVPRPTHEEVRGERLEVREHSPSEELEGGYTTITIPLTRSAVYSGVHGSIIDELGAADQIRAVCEVEYFTNEHILSAYRAGRITNLGNSLAPNIEALIDIHPDAILLSPFENSGGYGLIETTGIPIVECADYMETSPLGRAEWMKFYGLLYGKAEEADSLFHEVETAYNNLKESVERSLTSNLSPLTSSQAPRVISDLITGSTWYVPGGRSTMGRLIADAGGDYIFKERKESGSLALAPETVFAESQDADVWFMKYTNSAGDKTYQELASESPLYPQMKAFKEKRVYGCNLSYVHFYNDLPYHPERHLRDMIRMFHPQLLPDHQLKYYKPLE
ncbi:MAG: ABC transporter substrate-binding protein [Bacteroidaceae bacterium]|nr:ABC transporter substrate-binding protein [Bacteroidaceae bacterium]